MKYQIAKKLMRGRHPRIVQRTTFRPFSIASRYAMTPIGTDQKRMINRSRPGIGADCSTSSLLFWMNEKSPPLGINAKAHNTMLSGAARNGPVVKKWRSHSQLGSAVLRPNCTSVASTVTSTSCYAPTPGLHSSVDDFRIHPVRELLRKTQFTGAPPGDDPFTSHQKAHD